MQPRKRRRPGNPQFERKTAQLCRQIERRLVMAVAELEDPLLDGVVVVDVEASPDGGRMLVAVACEPDSPAARADPLEVLGRLARARPRLREDIAAGIHRRRTPELDFRLGRIFGHEDA